MALPPTFSSSNVHPMQNRSKSNTTKPKCPLSLSSLCSKNEPASSKEASQKHQWQEAIANEFQALIANDI